MPIFSHRTMLTLIALACAKTAMAEPTVRMFADDFRIGTVEGITLTKAQEKQMRGFRAEKSYFGAFFVVPGGQDAFWVNNFHQFDMAKRAARKGCELTSGQRCTLYAVSYPSEVDPTAKGVAGIGRWALDVYTGLYADAQVRGRHGAFAISGASHFGYAFNYVDAAQAEGRAIAECDAAVAREMTQIGNEGREWARAGGLTTCRIIDRHEPE